jgi:hypothetical protein
VKKIRKWKESTTTSPSGLHIGHHKSLISAHKFSFDNKNPTQSATVQNVGSISQIHEYTVAIINGSR